MGNGRGLGECFTCVQYLMFAFNFLFWLLGCALLGVGIWIRSDPMFHPYVDSGDVFNHIHVGAYLLIGVGVVVMVIGFLGLCGAIQESQMLLSLFFVSLFIIFAILLGAGVWATVRKDTVKEALGQVISGHVTDYYTKNNSRQFMDDLQIQFGCCGDEGYKDYLQLANKTHGKNCEYIEYTFGCTERVFQFVIDKFVVIAGCAIGIGIVMLLGMVFSMLMCCSIRDSVS